MNIKKKISLLILTLCLLIAFSLIMPTSVIAMNSGYNIRVLLKTSSTTNNHTITISEGKYYIVHESNPRNILAEVWAGESITFSYSSGTYSYSCNKGSSNGREIFLAIAENADSKFTFDNNQYRGGFKVMSNDTYTYAINVIDIELYLYGVIGRELGYNYHIEALKAQAVASRSYALGNISSNNTYYDVTATTASQVYDGSKAENDSTHRAVDATYGMVLLYDQKVVPAYFSSNAGGHTEDIEKVWTSDDIPLKGVSSTYDSRAGNYSSYGASCYSWLVEYTPKELVTLANTYGKTDIGSYRSISMSTSNAGQTSVSGRAMIVTITGSSGSVNATKDNIRNLLSLKSTLIRIDDNVNNPTVAYVIDKGGEKFALSSLTELFAIGADFIKMNANADEKSIYVVNQNGVTEISKTKTVSDKIVISGNGYGHGVGMSQWGAIAMADDGYKWDDIIKHYYCNNGIKLASYY